MKKVIGLLLLITMIIGSSVLVFADTDTDVVCELDPEVWETMLALKTEFLSEQVAAEVITQDEADELIARLTAKEGIGVLRELGFGLWLRENDQFEELEALLPHKGFRGGSFRMNAGTFEEIKERRANGECPAGFDPEDRGGMFSKEGFQGKGRGFRFQSTDAE